MSVCATCNGTKRVWTGHGMFGDYDKCPDCKGTGLMSAIELYEGAQVKTRNGAMFVNLQPWKVGGMAWTGARVGDGHLYTWTADGSYYGDGATSGYDIVEVLPTIGGDATPTINRIERADVEDFHASAMLPNLLNRYQAYATKSAEYPGKGTPFGLMYIALGLQEAGEVQGKVKKAFRDDGLLTFINDSDYATTIGVYDKPLSPERRAQIIKEVGGLLWYVAALCNEINATMSEIALANLEELAGRTERGTLRGDGDDR